MPDYTYRQEIEFVRKGDPQQTKRDLDAIRDAATQAAAAIKAFHAAQSGGSSGTGGSAAPSAPLAAPRPASSPTGGSAAPKPGGWLNQVASGSYNVGMGAMYSGLPGMGGVATAGNALNGLTMMGQGLTALTPVAAALVGVAVAVGAVGTALDSAAKSAEGFISSMVHLADVSAQSLANTVRQTSAFATLFGQGGANSAVGGLAHAQAMASPIAQAQQLGAARASAGMAGLKYSSAYTDPFAMFGISTFNPTSNLNKPNPRSEEDVIYEAARRLSNTSDPGQHQKALTLLGQQLGGVDNLARLEREFTSGRQSGQTDQQTEARLRASGQKFAIGITDEDVKRMDQFTQAQNELALSWQKLAVDAGREVLPALTGFFKLLTGGIDTVRGVSSWLHNLNQSLGVFGPAVLGLVSPLSGVIALFDSLHTTGNALGGVFGWVGQQIKFFLDSIGPVEAFLKAGWKDAGQTLKTWGDQGSAAFASVGDAASKAWADTQPWRDQAWKDVQFAFNVAVGWTNDQAAALWSDVKAAYGWADKNLSFLVRFDWLAPTMADLWADVKAAYAWTDKNLSFLVNFDWLAPTMAAAWSDFKAVYAWADKNLSFLVDFGWLAPTMVALWADFKAVYAWADKNLSFLVRFDWLAPTMVDIYNRIVGALSWTDRTFNFLVNFDWVAPTMLDVYSKMVSALTWANKTFNFLVNFDWVAPTMVDVYTKMVSALAWVDKTWKFGVNFDWVTGAMADTYNRMVGAREWADRTWRFGVDFGWVNGAMADVYSWVKSAREWIDKVWKFGVNFDWVTGAMKDTYEWVKDAREWTDKVLGFHIDFGWVSKAMQAVFDAFSAAYQWANKTITVSLAFNPLNGADKTLELLGRLIGTGISTPDPNAGSTEPSQGTGVNSRNGKGQYWNGYGWQNTPVDVGGASGIQSLGASDVGNLGSRGATVVNNYNTSVEGQDFSDPFVIEKLARAVSDQIAQNIRVMTAGMGLPR